jgi:hypothetical protein
MLITAISVTSLLALSGCSSGDSSKDATKNTLEPGMTILPGTIESEKVNDLPAECEEAVEPLRGLMEKYDSGLEITDSADNAKLTDLMNAAAGECKDDYTRFYNQELLGWLNAEPSKVPSAPATTAKSTEDVEQDAETTDTKAPNSETTEGSTPSATTAD